MTKKIIFVWFVLLISWHYAFDGARYLIIAPDNYVQYVTPLAEWKTKKGMLAYIAPLSVTGNTATQIKNYIVNAYNNWRIPPEYILLVGAGNILPSSSIGGGNYSDDYYADMNGDYKIELTIGRIPCSNTTQCQTIVAKILGYERTPYLTDTSWYKKGTTIVREDGTTHPDTVYWNNVRYIQSFWRNISYSKIDSFSRLRGNRAQDVINAINNGRSFVVYRGEATVNWYNPFQINPSQTSNGFMLPVVISGTCGTISLVQTGYLGDLFLNAGTAQSPKGAVGFFGASVSTSGYALAWHRGLVTMGFFTALYQNNLYKLGDAAKRAKFILDSIRPPNYVDTRYKEWNLFGDPELNLWTDVPRQLTVYHDTLIPTRPQQFTVTVQRLGIPVTNAVVCIMKDTSIYETGYTNNQGQISFTIYPQTTGTMSVTVTKQNYIPYEKNVTIYQSNIEHDVGVMSIIEPQGLVPATTNVVPKVRIRNFGTHTDTFAVHLKIGTVYDETINNVILSANDTMTVLFPTWVAEVGNYSTVAFTDLTNDEWHNNDTIYGSVSVVITQDVGVDAILSPDSLHLINTTIIPTARIKNYGTLAQVNFTATCSIIGSNNSVRYTSTKTIQYLVANDTIRVNFDPWQPTVAELCTVKIRTNLAGDQNPTNDKKIKSVRISATAINEEEINSISAISYSLSPNPSPKNVISIKLTTSKPTEVSIKIFNAIGNLIKTIVNNQVVLGQYHYEWQCQDEMNRKVEAGIYFLKLQVANQTDTKKIVITP
ncbi:MAG: C25 family cysteine peptidase [candidate division WOR-3 bacterium]